VLDGFEELKLCVGYRLDGVPVDHLPAAQGAQARVEPIGMHHPQSCRKSARIIKAHIIKYGEKRGLELLNNMWKALEIVRSS